MDFLCFWAGCGRVAMGVFFSEVDKNFVDKK